METTAIYITISILGVIAVIVALMKVKQVKEKNEKENPGTDVSPITYLASIFTIIQGFIQDCLSTISINISDYSTPEEYYKALIGIVITKLKEQAPTLGIDVQLLNMIDQDLLEHYIYLAISKVVVSVSSVSTNKTVAELEDKAAIIEEMEKYQASKE